MTNLAIISLGICSQEQKHMLEEVHGKDGVYYSLGLLFFRCSEACVKLFTILCWTWFLLKYFPNGIEIGASFLLSCSLASWNSQLDDLLAILSSLKEKVKQKYSLLPEKI